MRPRYLLLLCLFSSSPLWACQCIWQGSFDKVIHKADLVVSGTISQHLGNAADFVVDKVHQGKEYQEIIRIWGDTGKLCRPNIYQFPEQSQWLFALQRINEDVPGGFNPNTPSFSYGRIGDYSLSNCGAYWLKLEHGFVSGNLVNGPRWQWLQKKMNPVRIELIDAFMAGKVGTAALIEAAKPQTELKKLMQQTQKLIDR